MARLLFLILVFGSYVDLRAQTVFRRMASFPSELNEISGMVLLGDTLIALNDGSNPSRLYLCDTSGNILRTIHIQAPNLDWEELTLSHEHLFIGDFGNNDNTRKDLRILKVPIRELGKDTITPELILFTYEDQKAFPPAPSQLHFDAEAMVWMKDTLHLFTKNRTSPFDGEIRHYKLPALSGQHVARLHDSFQAGGFLKELFWVTGAALSNNENELALLSSDKVYWFNGYSRSDFFRGTFKNIPLGDISQKEAIVFQDYSNLFISDEANSLQSAGLYHLKFNSFAITPEMTNAPVFLYSKKDQMVHIRSEKVVEYIQVFSSDGRLVCRIDMQSQNHVFSVANWTTGHYLCEIISENKKLYGAFKIF